MPDISKWDWESGSKELADIGAMKEQFSEVHEFVVSNDGEKIAAPVATEDGKFTAAVNGKALDKGWEKLWNLGFGPDDRMSGMVMEEDEWTIMIDGEAWEEKFEYVWNIMFSEDGSVIAAQVKRDMKYSMCINDKPWNNWYAAMRDCDMSADGAKVASTVQTVALKEGDIYGFKEGSWSVAVDDKPWVKNYQNTWMPVVGPNGKVAVQARKDYTVYTITVDGTDWANDFICVWEAVFSKDGSDIVAPVKHNGSWHLAKNAEIFWKNPYMQLWRPNYSPDGNRIAALAAVGFGQWTVVVDDKPWSSSWKHMILDTVFSSDSARVAAPVNTDHRWTIAVDGQGWDSKFDMIWQPVFSPDSSHVLAKAEQDKKFLLVIDGKVVDRKFDMLFDPLFSPDSSKVLIKGVSNGKYTREVVELSKLI
jgi:hypothetical protein